MTKNKKKTDQFPDTYGIDEKYLIDMAKSGYIPAVAGKDDEVSFNLTLKDYNEIKEELTELSSFAFRAARENEYLLPMEKIQRKKIEAIESKLSELDLFAREWVKINNERYHMLFLWLWVLTGGLIGGMIVAPLIKYFWW